MTECRLSKADIESIIQQWGCKCGYDVEVEWDLENQDLPLVMSYRHLSEIGEAA